MPALYENALENQVGIAYNKAESIFKGRGKVRPMRMIDVTRPINTNMTVWPGDESILIEHTSSISEGKAVNVSRVHMGVHAGTHVDAPLHFIDDGKSVDELDPSLFTGWVQVVDVREAKMIQPEHISQVPFHKIDAVFFKTSYSDKTLNEAFETNYTGLSLDAAQMLLERGIRVIGTDALSIESFYEENFRVHKALLGNEVFIVEGLSLKHISPSRYRYICLPLLIKGSDGSPARVFLIEE
jgi:arylformamidase